MDASSDDDLADLAGVGRDGVAQTEFEDDAAVIARKVGELATLMSRARESGRGIVLHAGAGISTAASIPDFRGPKGVWVLQATGKELDEADYGTEFEDALPTLGHMAVVGLLRAGFLTYVSSQNVDGLFLRAGVPEDQLSELHGNVYLETCRRCRARYLRDFDAAADGDDSHNTSRRCSKATCTGRLMDSIIDFGESLPYEDEKRARQQSQRAALSLVVGTSLTVTPASLMPKLTLERTRKPRRGRGATAKEEDEGAVAIVNLQRTYLDKQARVHIHGKSDDVFARLVKELNVEIPKFVWKVKVNILNTASRAATKKRDGTTSLAWQLFVSGECGYASRFLRRISVRLPSNSRFRPSMGSAVKTKTLVSDDGMFDVEGSALLPKEYSGDSAVFSVDVDITFADICGGNTARLKHKVELLRQQRHQQQQQKEGPEFLSDETYEVTVQTVDYNDRGEGAARATTSDPRHARDSAPFSTPKADASAAVIDLTTPPNGEKRDADSASEGDPGSTKRRRKRR